jgi:hypothetical protein
MERQRVRAATIDDSEFENAIEGRGGDRLPVHTRSTLRHRCRFALIWINTLAGRVLPAVDDVGRSAATTPRDRYCRTPRTGGFL